MIGAWSASSSSAFVRMFAGPRYRHGSPGCSPKALEPGAGVCGVGAPVPLRLIPDLPLATDGCWPLRTRSSASTAAPLGTPRGIARAAAGVAGTAGPLVIARAGGLLTGGGIICCFVLAWDSWMDSIASLPLALASGSRRGRPSAGDFFEGFTMALPSERRSARSSR
eukprot:4122554-Prymnesium_polylepis.1